MRDNNHLTLSCQRQRSEGSGITLCGNKAGVLALQRDCLCSVWGEYKETDQTIASLCSLPNTSSFSHENYNFVQLIGASRIRTRACGDPALISSETPILGMMLEQPALS